MKELKQTLKNLVDRQAYLKSALPAAPVLVLIDPLLLLIYNISYFRFYYLTGGLFFVIYLAGLVLCLAAENDWAPGLAFAIKTLAFLISFASYATFSKLVYVALYGVAAFYFLREFFMSEQGKKLAADFAAKSNPSMTKTTTTITCPGCGLQIQALSGGGFCPRCGGPLPVVEQPQPQPQPVNPGTQAGRLTAFCSGGIFMIFMIVMTAKLVCSTVLQFNLLNLIGSIPAIIVCLGLWFSWSGCRKGQLKSNGFRLISGALLANLIISWIPVVLFLIVGIFFLSIDDGAAIGLGVIIGAFIDGFLFYLYWMGLRRTAKSASAVADGTIAAIETSMFSIVLLFAGGIVTLISLIAMAGSASAISMIVNRSLSGLYYLDIPDSALSVLIGYIRSYFAVDWKKYVVQFLTAATPICAGITLCSVRGSQSR